MPDIRENDGYDDQDGAEAFDEANLDEHEELNEMRTFEELPDLFDATRADGDRDESEAAALDADEFDEDAFDDGDLEEDHELDYRAAAYEDEDQGFDEDQIAPDSLEGLDQVADAGVVSGGEVDFTNFQAKGLSDEDLLRMGYAGRTDPAAEEALEIGLEDSFPASDPVSVTRPRR